MIRFYQKYLKNIQKYAFGQEIMIHWYTISVISLLELFYSLTLKVHFMLKYCGFFLKVVIFCLKTTATFEWDFFMEEVKLFLPSLLFLLTFKMCRRTNWWKKSLGYWNFCLDKKMKMESSLLWYFYKQSCLVHFKDSFFFPSCYNGFSFLLLKIIFKFSLSYFWSFLYLGLYFAKVCFDVEGKGKQNI